MLRAFLLPYMVVEIIAAYLFITEFGFLNLVLETIFTAIVGIFFMFRIGFFELTSKIAFLRARDIFGVLGTSIGGFFLFIPGIMSDILGVLVIIFALISNFKSSKTEAKNSSFYNRKNDDFSPKFDDEIIDVEIVEDSVNTIKGKV